MAEEEHVAQLMNFCIRELGKANIDGMHDAARNDVHDALAAVRINNTALHELLTGTVMLYWMTGFMSGHSHGFRKRAHRNE